MKVFVAVMTAGVLGGCSDVQEGEGHAPPGIADWKSSESVQPERLREEGDHLLKYRKSIEKLFLDDLDNLEMGDSIIFTVHHRYPGGDGPFFYRRTITKSQSLRVIEL